MCFTSHWGQQIMIFLINHLALGYQLSSCWKCHRNVWNLLTWKFWDFNGRQFNLGAEALQFSSSDLGICDFAELTSPASLYSIDTSSQFTVCFCKCYCIQLMLLHFNHHHNPAVFYCFFYWGSSLLGCCARWMGNCFLMFWGAYHLHPQG